MTDDSRRDSDIERHDGRRPDPRRQVDLLVLAVISGSIAVLALVAVRSPEELGPTIGWLTGVAALLLTVVRRED